MAIGDDAANAGYQLVPTTGEDGKVKYGAREINRTRDYVANVKSYIEAVKALIPAEQTWEWTTLTATNGWTANTGDGAPRVRRDGNVVTFRGGLYGGTAFTQATWLPSWARPNMETTILTWNGTNNGTVAVTVYGGGAMNLGGTLGAEQMCQWTVV